MQVVLPPDLTPAAGEKIDEVLETLALCDDTQIVLARLTDGKFKAISKSWDEAKVILPDPVLEVRLVEGRIRVSRKSKRRDLGDLHNGADPVGPEGEITEFIGA